MINCDLLLETFILPVAENYFCPPRKINSIVLWSPSSHTLTLTRQAVQTQGTPCLTIVSLSGYYVSLVTIWSLGHLSARRMCLVIVLTQSTEWSLMLWPSAVGFASLSKSFTHPRPQQPLSTLTMFVSSILQVTMSITIT